MVDRACTLPEKRLARNVPQLGATAIQAQQLFPRRYFIYRRVGAKAQLAESNSSRTPFMERAIETPEKVLSRDGRPEHESGLLSTASVLNLQKLIFAGSPLSEVLTNVA